MLDGLHEPGPQPGEVGSSATITVQIVIDSYPTLLESRGAGGEPIDAVQDAVQAVLEELPMLVTDLSARITEQYPVQMYLADDEDEADDF
jgi:L-lactate utilization protein LutB